MHCSVSATAETIYLLIALTYFDDDEGLKFPLGNRNIDMLLKFKCKYFFNITKDIFKLNN